MGLHEVRLDMVFQSDLCTTFRVYITRDASLYFERMDSMEACFCPDQIRSI
jgi:hypothetical protein